MCSSNTIYYYYYYLGILSKRMEDWQGRPFKESDRLGILSIISFENFTREIQSCFDIVSVPKSGQIFEV